MYCNQFFLGVIQEFLKNLSRIFCVSLSRLLCQRNFFTFATLERFLVVEDICCFFISPKNISPTQPFSTPQDKISTPQNVDQMIYVYTSNFARSQKAFWGHTDARYVRKVCRGLSTQFVVFVQLVILLWRSFIYEEISE
jgi:hypothetical protein